MPIYTVRYVKDKKYLKLEILKNDEPFWEDLPGAKRHFKINNNQAETILACLDTIRDFYYSNGKNPEAEIWHKFIHDKLKLPFKYYKHNGFHDSSGHWQNRPYIELSGFDHIQFGLLKSEGILKRIKDKNFASNNDFV